MVSITLKVDVVPKHILPSSVNIAHLVLFYESVHNSIRNEQELEKDRFRVC